MRKLAEHVRRTLATQDRSTLLDAQRLRALLNDLMPGRRREIHVLTSVIQEGIAAQLMEQRDEIDDFVCSRYVRLLYNQTGIDEVWGKWAVRQWCELLSIQIARRGASRNGVRSADADDWTEDVPRQAPLFTVGDYVRFGRYNEEPILWRVVHLDTSGNPVLLSDRILTLKAFDAAGARHADLVRGKLGSNFYENSTLRRWLNSRESVVHWEYNEPSADNVRHEENPYHLECGFLAERNFTEREKRLIAPYTLRVLLAKIDQSEAEGGSESHEWVYQPPDAALANYDTAYYKDVKDLVFCLSLLQLKEWVYDQRRTLGQTYHLARPTPQAIAASRSRSEHLSAEEPWRYWLNTPSVSAPCTVRIVDTDGIVYYGLASYGNYGVRPALQLDVRQVTLPLVGVGSAEEPYLM